MQFNHAGPSSANGEARSSQMQVSSSNTLRNRLREEESTEFSHKMERSQIALYEDQPRTWRSRPLHRRRASQPVGRSTFTTDHEVFEDSSSLSGGASDDGDSIHSQQDRLEYLDLSVSLPYSLASLRTHLIAYMHQLEERARLLRNRIPPTSSSMQRSDSSMSLTFTSHLDAIKEDLRALANSLPNPVASLSIPEFPSKASAAIVAKGQSLMQDWERLSKTLQIKLAIREQGELAATDGSASLPSLLTTVQERFDALQETIRQMTFRELLFSTSNHGNENVAVGPSFAESIFDTVKARSYEAQIAGRARANSFAKAAKEAEEHIYAKAVELARNGQRLIRYEHLPELWKNNEHILSGYRFIPKEDWGSLLKSTFQLHNETGNIMTHLIGALIVAPLFWPSKDRYDDQTTPMDRMVQTIYLIAALKCLLLSVSWHVMAGCSDACLFERFACVDYTGIAWLVAASVWTLVYNAFYCQPNLAMVYSLSTLLVGLVGAIVPWAKWFNDRKNKPLRIAVFLAMCFTGFAPFTHALLSHGVMKTIEFFGAILPSCFMYIFGLLFYSFQFPERFWPGKFDVVGHAHQIWHISIVIAILLHHRATFYWHENRFNFSCPIETKDANSLFSNPLANDLYLADEMIHGWRIIAGRLGDGLVGRIWDSCVEKIMSTF